MKKNRSRPTEHQEQCVVARWLDLRGVLYAHPPNGGHRSATVGARLKQAGTKPGLPDLLIFDPPPRAQAVGVAIEMKRVGASPSTVSRHQRAWLAALEERGWVALVARGAAEAIGALEALGYGRPAGCGR